MFSINYIRILRTHKGRSTIIKGCSFLCGFFVCLFPNCEQVCTLLPVFYFDQRADTWQGFGVWSESREQSFLFSIFKWPLSGSNSQPQLWEPQDLIKWTIKELNKHSQQETEAVSRPQISSSYSFLESYGLLRELTYYFFPPRECSGSQLFFRSLPLLHIAH